MKREKTKGKFAILALGLCMSAVFTEGTVRAQNYAEEWWHGKYASGDWLGARTSLEDHGIIFSGSWKGTYGAVVDGGLQQRGAFDEELKFRLKLDFEKMAGIPGLSAYGEVRWRDGQDLNQFAGASPAFSPTSYQVGKQWRLMPFYLMWESRNLFLVENLVTLSGGWQNPYDFFLQQPESKLFQNNAITQTKGIAANGVPFNGSYAAWGGTFKLQPTKWFYTQHGFYMATPQATVTANHGLDLAGFAPDPSQNGLYYMGEIGFTPKIGPSALPGKYAFGGYYFGNWNNSFFGERYPGRYGLYWQADQMLFRESSPELPSPSGKDSKSVVDGKTPAPSHPTPNEQGLYAFSMLNYSPDYNNSLPLYFQTGLVYKGPIPSRDKDRLGIAFGYGSYSYDNIVARRDAGLGVQKTMEAVLEVDYRVQLTKFASVQPYLQYLIRPNGTGTVENATILGVHFETTF